MLTRDTWRAFLDTLPPQTDIAQARVIHKQYDAGMISQAVFLDQVLAVTGKHPQQVESLPASKVTKNTQLLEYIGWLKQSYKIGLLSNIASNWIKDSFLTTKEQALFDHMVFSYKVGLTKPDPQIFTLMCEQLGVAPAETIMVDDIAEYCQAAEALGMKSVHYQDFNQCKLALEQLLHHT